MENPPISTSLSQIYHDTYFDLLKAVPDDLKARVEKAVGQDNVTDNEVISFMKRVISKAERDYDKLTSQPQVKSETKAAVPA